MTLVTVDSQVSTLLANPSLPSCTENTLVYIADIIP
jgi:hypothetical protein